jgi:hypothetical protein
MLSAGVVSAWVVFSIAGCTKKTDAPTSSAAEGRTSTAPSGREAANEKMALVRFVNATPGQSMDLWFGNDQAFSNIGYKTVTPYRELPGERHEFALRFAGAGKDSAPKVTTSEGLSDGGHYTVIALLDSKGNPKLNVVRDNLSESKDSRARVRVVNASTQEVDVYSPLALNEGAGRAKQGTADRVKGNAVQNRPEKWFDGVDADSATGYKDVNAANTTVTVRPSSNKNAAGAGVKVPVDLAAGRLYTFVVVGGGNAHALDVVKIVDQVGATLSPMPTGRS